MLQSDTCVGRRVLVVEDQAVIALSIAMALERVGATVLGPVGSVKSAVDVLGRHDHIDAAVLDVKLSDGSVFPVAEELQRRRIPFAFTTAYGDKLPKRYRNSPVFDKPMTADQIAWAICSDVVTRRV